MTKNRQEQEPEGGEAARSGPTIHEAQGEHQPLLCRQGGAEGSPRGLDSVAAHIALPKWKRCALTKMPPTTSGPQEQRHSHICSPRIVTLNRNRSRVGPYDDQVARRSRFVGQTCFVDQGLWGHLEGTFGRADKSVKQTSQPEAQHHQRARSRLGRTYRSISCKGPGCPLHSQSSTYRMP